MVGGRIKEKERRKSSNKLLEINEGEVGNAEQRFRWLLEQRGYKWWDEGKLEQKIEVKNTRPDFFVETPQGNILTEIKCLEKPGPLERRKNRVGVIKVEEVFKRLNRPVRDAADQLLPYRDLGIPLLIVLDNWRRIRIPMRCFELAQIWQAEDQREYISAVAVNMSKEGCCNKYVTFEERPMRLRIVHNPFALCPMPLTLFRDKDDEHYCRRDNRWERVA